MEKNAILKSHDHNFFARCVFSQGIIFGGLLYLSISSGVFVVCHFCKDNIFQIASRGAFLAGFIFLILLWFLFLIAMWIMNIILDFSHCNYLLFYLWFEEKLVIEHEIGIV